jgi:hypothetical protein
VFHQAGFTRIEITLRPASIAALEVLVSVLELLDAG